jgi:serine protease Do
MPAWKGAALTAALMSAVGLGAVLAPVAHGQAVKVAPRAVQISGGRGSQIGVSIRDVEQSDAKSGTLAAASGVIVEEVVEDGPAAKAGVRKGDIVIEFDGDRVRSVRQFSRLVQETPAGRRVQTSVLRDGQKMTLTIEPRESNAFSVFRDFDSARVLDDLVGDWPVPPAPPARPARPAPPAPPPAPFPDIESFIWRTGNGLGITVGDLSTQLAQYFGTKDGVLVTSVADDSAGAKAGIKAGDVITSLNGSDVASPSDLRRRLQRLQDGDDFTVGVVRDKKSLALKGKVETLRPRRTYRSVI